MSRGEAEGAGMWWVGAQSLAAKDLSDLTTEGVIIRYLAVGSLRAVLVEVM